MGQSVHSGSTQAVSYMHTCTHARTHTRTHAHTHTFSLTHTHSLSLALALALSRSLAPDNSECTAVCRRAILKQVHDWKTKSMVAINSAVVRFLSRCCDKDTGVLRAATVADAGTAVRRLLLFKIDTRAHIHAHANTCALLLPFQHRVRVRVRHSDVSSFFCLDG